MQFISKKSADGNHAAVINLHVTHMFGPPKLLLGIALHSKTDSPNPAYDCQGCSFLDGASAEMHEGWGAGALEKEINKLIADKLESMLAYAAKQK